MMTFLYYLLAFEDSSPKDTALGILSLFSSTPDNGAWQKHMTNANKLRVSYMYSK